MNPMHAHSEPDCPPPVSAIPVPVLGTRPLRPGTELAVTSLYGDDSWDLTPACFQQQRVAAVLAFTTVDPRYRALCKELFFTLLNGPQPPRERALLQITTIAPTFATVRHFLNWLAANHNAPALSTLTARELLDYQRHLRHTQPNLSVRDHYRSAVRFFWRYRQSITLDRLSIDPQHIEGWGERGDRGRSENSTERIPEHVLGPLLAWSVRFVDDFAPDIIAADLEWRRIRKLDDTVQPAANRYYVRGALDELLASHRATDRPLPGRNGKPSRAHLAATLGCHRSTLREYQDLIDDTARIVGVTDHPTFTIPITGLLDGKPWIDHITTARSDRRTGGAHLATLLSAACYVVIAFLSGMRDSEIKHLRRGCIRIQRDQYDKPYRWMITSRAFKGEQDPTGVDATWAVGAPVARAVRVLEQLQPADEDRMFAPLMQSPAVGRGETAEHVTLTSTTNNHLNALVAWINDYCGEHDRGDQIPLVNNRPWRLTTRQFRRTLAWFIARRPGGAIAGAIAYRHQAIQMFEGYAGTSDSGFRAEVESEQALARGEHLMAMIDTDEHNQLSGPSAAEAHRRLTEFGAHTRFQGQAVTDHRRLERILRRHDPAIYPGRYATCVFEPRKALCTRTHSPTGKALPTLADCRPLDCHNVALTETNLTELRNEVTVIDEHLNQRPSHTPLLKARLEERRDQITRFLHRHSPEGAS